MFCIECGAQLPDGAKFCPQCGTKTMNVESSNTTSSTIPPATRIVSQKAQWEELPMAEPSAREDRLREVLVDKANWEGEAIELEQQENSERLETAVKMIVESVKNNPRPAPKPLKPKITRKETFFPELLIVKKQLEEAEYTFDNHADMIECCYYALTKDSVLIYDPSIEMIDEYKLEYHPKGMRARNDSFGLAILILVGVCMFVFAGLFCLVEWLGGDCETLSIPLLCVSIVITLIFAYRTYYEKAHFEILKDTKNTLEFKEVIATKNP